MRVQVLNDVGSDRPAATSLDVRGRGGRAGNSAMNRGLGVLAGVLCIPLTSLGCERSVVSATGGAYGCSSEVSVVEAVMWSVSVARLGSPESTTVVVVVTTAPSVLSLLLSVSPVLPLQVPLPPHPRWRGYRTAPMLARVTITPCGSSSLRRDCDVTAREHTQ